jgi:glucose dehydrogenase
MRQIACYLTATFLSGLIIVLLRLAFTALGAWLVAVGFLLVKARREALWLYTLILVCTVLWSIVEVEFDGWQLMPRPLSSAYGFARRGLRDVRYRANISAEKKRLLPLSVTRLSQSRFWEPAIG